MVGGRTVPPTDRADVTKLHSLKQNYNKRNFHHSKHASRTVCRGTPDAGTQKQKQQCKITSYTYDLGLPSTIANDLNLASKVNKDVHNGDCISSTDSTVQIASTNQPLFVVCLQRRDFKRLPLLLSHSCRQAWRQRHMVFLSDSSPQYLNLAVGHALDVLQSACGNLQAERHSQV